MDLFKSLYFFVMLFSSLFLTGCSFNPKKSIEKINPFKKDKDSTFLVKRISPRWFNFNHPLSLRNQEGEIVPHDFFDASPSYDRKEQTLNVVIVTPYQSEHEYLFDVRTGQHLIYKRYCQQKDIYKKSTQNISVPPFSLGFIPRTLDQIGDLHKILVFGEVPLDDKKEIQHHFFPVRIVGGYIEHICPNGKCLNSQNYISRLVFIAVFKDDKKFKNVASVKDLSEEVNWEEATTFIENGQGNNVIAQEKFPRIKMGATLDADQAIEVFSQHSLQFSLDEMKELQVNCLRLFDHAWSKLGTKNEKSFTGETSDFLGQFGKEYLTCLKYMPSSNPASQLEQFKFFSYFDAYVFLLGQGHYFNCQAKSWDFNPHFKSNYWNTKKVLASCSDQTMDLAMSTAPQYLLSLEKSFQPSYRFVEYDNHGLGTHNRFFGWIKTPSGKLACLSSTEDQDVFRQYHQFPLDLKWNYRYEKSSLDMNEKNIIK